MSETELPTVEQICRRTGNVAPGRSDRLVEAAARLSHTEPERLYVAVPLIPIEMASEERREDRGEVTQDFRERIRSFIREQRSLLDALDE